VGGAKRRVGHVICYRTNEIQHLVLRFEQTLARSRGVIRHVSSALISFVLGPS